MSTLDHKLEREVTSVHRLEVISGTGRRRQFTEDFKARVVEETLVPGAIVSGVARQLGLTPQQVFTWRRQARHTLANTESKAPQFVPAIVETALPPAVLRGRQRKRTGQASRSGPWSSSESLTQLDAPLFHDREQSDDRHRWNCHPQR